MTVTYQCLTMSFTLMPAPKDAAELAHVLRATAGHIERMFAPAGLGAGETFCATLPTLMAVRDADDALKGAVTFKFETLDN